MKNNGPSKNEPIDLNNPSSKDIAKLNSVLTHENPMYFMPSIAHISRDDALSLLELVHSGKLSPSYQSYGYLLVLSLAGTQKKAVKLFSDGMHYLRSRDETLDNDDNN